MTIKFIFYTISGEPVNYYWYAPKNVDEAAIRLKAFKLMNKNPILHHFMWRSI